MEGNIFFNPEVLFVKLQMEIFLVGSCPGHLLILSTYIQDVSVKTDLFFWQRLVSDLQSSC